MELKQGDIVWVRAKVYQDIRTDEYSVPVSFYGTTIGVLKADIMKAVNPANLENQKPNTLDLMMPFSTNISEINIKYK